jgi:hypothetical protein
VYSTFLYPPARYFLLITVIFYHKLEIFAIPFPKISNSENYQNFPSKIAISNEKGETFVICR